jgi:2'-5' RNA ligase
MQHQPAPHRGHPGKLHRCFYAVRLGSAVEGYLGGLIDALRRHGGGVRWVPVRNLHLTLRFLGEIGEEQLAKAIAMPDPGASFAPFSLRARGLGAFPLMRAPKVIWAGVAGEAREDTDRLLHLQALTERSAMELGLPQERRPYSPHITLGRVSPPFHGLKELIDDLIGRECESPLCTVDELLLMRSSLMPEGAHYEVVRRWDLRAVA